MGKVENVSDESLTETLYLLSTPANAKLLLDSIAQDKNNQAQQISLDEIENSDDKM